jgi:chromosome partitioning protein
MSNIVAFANMKGGVGKTTLALSMAEALASVNKSVLFIDLDLQINASMTLLSDLNDDRLPWHRHQTVEDYLNSKSSNIDSEVMTFVDRTNNVHLLSGSPSISLFERRVLVSRKNVPAARLCFSAWMAELFREVRNYYELIICDCPPGLSLMSEATLALADLIIVPQVPDRLSTHGLQLYARYLVHDLALENVAARTAVFINRMKTTTVAQSYRERIRQDANNSQFPYSVFDSEYNDAVAFQRAMDRSRDSSFERVWADVHSVVVGASNELWNRYLRADTNEPQRTRTEISAFGGSHRRRVQPVGTSAK